MLASCFRSGDIRTQVLQMMYGGSRGEVADWSSPPRVRVALQGLVFALKRSLAHRSKRLASAWKSERATARALAQNARRTEA